MPAARGQCAVCRYRFGLRKDGTLQSHRLYSGHERSEKPCGGSGRPPLMPGAEPPARCWCDNSAYRPHLHERGSPPDVWSCPACMSYLASQPHLAGAAASVGITHGKSTGHMLRDYLSAYHDRDHAEAQQSGLLDGQAGPEAHIMFQEFSDALRDRYGSLPEVGGQ